MISNYITMTPDLEFNTIKLDHIISPLNKEQFIAQQILTDYDAKDVVMNIVPYVMRC